MQVTEHRARTYVANGVAGALVLVWFLTPYLIFVASLELATWFGEEPSHDEKVEGWTLMTAAMVTGLVAPLVAAWLGRRSRALRVVALVEFGLMALLVVVELVATLFEQL